MQHYVEPRVFLYNLNLFGYAALNVVKPEYSSAYARFVDVNRLLREYLDSWNFSVPVIYYSSISCDPSNNPPNNIDDGLYSADIVLTFTFSATRYHLKMRSNYLPSCVEEMELAVYA